MCFFWSVLIFSIHYYFNSARSRLSSVGKKGKKGKRKKSGKKKEPPPPPPVGPWIQKLHLLDNGIDAHGVGSTLGPVMCMKMFRKLVAHLHMPSIFSKKITNVFYIGINFFFYQYVILLTIL